MTVLKRLRWAIAAVAAVSAVAAVGTAVYGDIMAKNAPVSPAKPLAPPKVVDETSKTVFTDKPVLAYTQADGTTAFAWQLKPDLPAATRPKDVAVMIDTSASQAGDPMQRAAQIVQALAAQLSPNDRVDVWTVNLNHKDHTRSLTGGFKASDDKAVKKAADSLATQEYASGAVDLKAGVETVLGAFEQKAGRQQVVLYIGDGESAAGTQLTEGVRVALGRRMAEKNVQFFSVPLGLTIAANTLHGFGMLTGGTVVRVKEDLGTPTGRHEFVRRLTDALDVPVLVPEKVTLAPAGTDLLPAQLPPLRADRPTLVMGSVKAGTDKLTVTVTGRVAGQSQTVTQTDALPPAKADHYFLAAMLQQWQAGEAKNAPVVLPADRALAMASEQFRLYRDEFVELALQAITADKLDHAQKLFQAALKVDPEYPEAKAGDKAVGRIRAGEITKKDFNQQINLQNPADPKPADAAPPAADVDSAARALAARNAADAESKALVDETLRRVRGFRETDPDGAYEDLKRQRDAIKSNDRLSDNVRTRLIADLDSLMRDVSTRAVEIKRRNEAVRERISRARALLNEYDLQMAEEDRTKARIDRFRFLMSQARFELAYREAQVMEQERVSRGLPVPPEVYTTYRVGQSATQLREQRELKRLREDRFLTTLLQVEKSFIPYPDEPPVHFPPATVWRELRERRAPYEFRNAAFGTNTPKSLLELRSIVEGTHDIPGVPKRVILDGPVANLDLPLVFDELERKFQRRIKFQIRDEMFKALAVPELEDIRKYKFKREQNLSGLTLGSFLDILLSEIKGSYIVRPEYIEITTAEQRLYQKVTRAFEIGDLALAVPNSINQQALNQNLAVFGSQLNNIGQSLGQAQFNGGFLQGGGNQGQGQGGIGGLPGGGGLNLGQGGGQAMGNNLGQLGCQANLGVGGGILGVTGGQIGQFGNLGGQFGIQGNNQSQILIQVISQMVAPGEWDSDFAGVGCDPNANPDDPPEAPIVKYPNSLGYYPVSNALIVRATSRYHPTQTFKFQAADVGAMAAAPRGGRNFAAADPNAMERVAGMNLPANNGQDILKAAGNDPKKLWNEVLKPGVVTEPSLVINAVDFLFQYKEYQQASEALKANLRRGHATGAWAYEALSIALAASKADSGEVERAALSAIDLDPQDPKAYLRAAKAEHDLGKNDVAIDLCKRAAALEPNLPAIYANALVYADAPNAGEVKSDVVSWATKNLLRRDWPNDGVDHAKTAKDSADRIAKKLMSADRKAEAEAVLATVAEEKNRDLMIELRWQGQADLDLSVNEPSGSDCTAMQKRTSGGGVLRSDLLEQQDENRSEVYTAAAAFNGKYTVSVSAALGRAIGNKATLKVTKYAGTDKEEVEVYTVDLAKPSPVVITMEGGSRTELATVQPDEMSGVRQISTQQAQVGAATGVSAGFGGADPATLNATNTPASAKNTAPVVGFQNEKRLPGVTPSLPGVRLISKVGAGSDTVQYFAQPVFTGKATDIPLPKVPLLPGAGN